MKVTTAEYLSGIQMFLNIFRDLLFINGFHLSHVASSTPSQHSVCHFIVYI